MVSEFTAKKAVAVLHDWTSVTLLNSNISETSTWLLYTYFLFLLQKGDFQEYLKITDK